MWQPCELLYTCYLLTFIQIYFRMHNFVVKFSLPQGIDPLTEICGRPWLRRRCCWALRPCRSVFTGRSAANRPQRCRMTGQTDGRTPGRHIHPAVRASSVMASVIESRIRIFLTDVFSVSLNQLVAQGSSCSCYRWELWGITGPSFSTPDAVPSCPTYIITGA